MIFAKRRFCEILSAWTIAISCLPAFSLSEEVASTYRKYQDGPLQIKEFKATPAKHAGGDAYTQCSIEFRFNYTYEKRDKLFVTTLTSFDAFSVFLPEKSWWKQQASPAILDHEQGHFDIAEVNALRLQIAFAKSFNNKRKIQGTGTTYDAAVKELRGSLSKVMQLANEQATQAHLDYDASTMHGMRYRRQGEQRRIQKATLQQLNKELTSLRKSKMASQGVE